MAPAGTRAISFIAAVSMMLRSPLAILAQTRVAPSGASASARGRRPTGSRAVIFAAAGDTRGQFPAVGFQNGDLSRILLGHKRQATVGAKDQGGGTARAARGRARQRARPLRRRRPD